MDLPPLQPEVIDTSLAKAYIKEYNNKQLNGWPEDNSYWSIENNTRITKKKCILGLSSLVDRKQVDGESTYLLVRRLANKIEEKCELFCQLENLLRGTRPGDVREGHIPLICQYIRQQEPIHDERNMIFINDEATPLYFLGYSGNLAYSKSDKINNIVVTSQKVAPIYYLFHELCCDVGLDIPLIYLNYNKDTIRIDSVNEPQVIVYEKPDCYWVITETSDVESALDVLKHSSTSAPWSVDRVYVQESALGELVRALEARGDAAPALALPPAHGAAGPPARRAAGPPVRAFRTPRELLGALRAAPPRLLAVWSGDAALAGELALGAAAPYVWVNAYARFTGPPRAALPLYQRHAVCRQGPQLGPERARSMAERARAWAAADDQRRADVLAGALAGGEARCAARAARTAAGHLHAAPGAVLTVAERPDDRLTLTDELFYDAIDPLVRGLPLCFYENRINGNLLAALIEAGVPVESVPIPTALLDRDPEINLYWKYHLCNVLVIHSSYGTIFAN